METKNLKHACAFCGTQEPDFYWMTMNGVVICLDCYPEYRRATGEVKAYMCFVASGAKYIQAFPSYCVRQ